MEKEQRGLRKSRLSPFGSRIGRVVLSILVVLVVSPLWAKNYEKTFDKALKALRKRDTSRIEKIYKKDAKKRRDRNKLLCMYELANFYQMLGETKQSMHWYALADSQAHIYERRAVISGNRVARTAGSMLSNDKVLVYEGAGYEKVMSRTLDALNYLMQGDLEGARVEIKKAEEYQELERTKHQKEIEKAEKKRQQDAKTRKAAEIAHSSTALQQKLQPMRSYSASVRNSFENAFTYYLSGLVYEADGGPDSINDAHLDFKRAYELAPSSPAVREAYLEITRRFDLSEYKKVCSELGVTATDPAPADWGTVTVIFERGLIPEKHEVRMDLPLRAAKGAQIVSLAFPVYSRLTTGSRPLLITAGSSEVKTARLLDMRPIAVKSLVEKMPGIITRAIVRGITKSTVQNEAGKRNGLLGLASNLWTVLSTRADLRGWYSLPAEVQAARIHLPPGRKTLILSFKGASQSLDVNVSPGGNCIVLYRAVPGYDKALEASLGSGTPLPTETASGLSPDVPKGSSSKSYPSGGT